VDALIEAGGRAPDMNTRLEKYQAAMRQAMVDLPVIPLWEVPWVYGVRDDITWTPPANGWFEARSAHRP
jgi:ABC-type oligopeptide transport system substrate-binding subunit